MLIPSIDLMDGRIVQLVQGERKALEFDDFEEWILRFERYPLVQLIDLDAAKGSGDNRVLLETFTRRLPCQVGGGIRSFERAEQAFAMGAKRVILGSVLIRNDQIDTRMAEEFAQRSQPGCLTFAIDAKGGKVAIAGWRQITPLTPPEMIRALEPYCGAFLYTHVDTEGLLMGIPTEAVGELRALTSRRLMVAGGIRSQDEVDNLDAMGVDAVVGMAIYTGRMKLGSHPA